MSFANAGGDDAHTRHLARVQALMVEMQAAISAIERNNLHDFQSALGKQEALCNELMVLRQTPLQDIKARELAKQLQAAYMQLAQFNRVYAGVVKRAKRWTDLLSLLYGLHGEGYGKTSGPPAQHQTLSCEV